MWDVTFQGNVTIPHVSASAYAGLAAESVGYFVCSRCEVGLIAQGTFLKGYKDIIVGGIGGIVAANELRRKLPSRLRIVLVERDAEHAFLDIRCWVVR